MHIFGHLTISRVSSYNTTPIKPSDNVTTRRKKSSPNRTTSLNASNETTYSDTHDSIDEIDSSEETVRLLQQQQVPSVEDQLVNYKSLKHSKFLTSHEGIAWKEKQLAEMEYSEAEMEILNDMYSEYEHDDEEQHHQHHDQQQHQPIDMSISIVDEGGVLGLEGLYTLYRLRHFGETVLP